jgi:hypothetical protein
MRRFASLKFACAETRRVLRDRFRRYLPVMHQPQQTPSGGNLISDEQWLNLLLNLEIDHGSDIDRARATYDAALPPEGSEPTFDEVFAAGWFRIVWGRITAPFEIDQRARAAPGGNLTALAALLKDRFKEKYSFPDAVPGNAELDGFMGEIKRGDKAPYSVRSQTPAWVGARLWDRALSSGAEHGADLRRWVDRWRLIGWPSLVAHRVWSEAAADAFREAALVLLETEPGLTGWEETRAGFVRQIGLRTGQRTDVSERYVPAMPITLLARALWLNDLRLEGAIAGMIAADQDLVGLIRVVLTDIDEQEFSPAPNPVFKRLMDVAVLRPEILVVVLFRVRWSPALLADLLLHPATSALACWLIGEWPGSSGTGDHDLMAKDDWITKQMAFGDAVSVLGDFLEQGSIPPAEAASLLGILYKRAKPLFGDEAADDRSIATILGDEIATQSIEKQQAVFTALATGAGQSGLGSAEFAAALDVVDAAGLTERVDPMPLVEAYIKSIRASAYGLSANRTSERAATSLVKLAMKAPEVVRRSFLAPVDVPSRIAAAAEPDVNSYTIEDETARSLRAHIRILCRAVSGLQESGSAELTAALIEAVRVGARKEDDKGRLGAFAARFEVDPYRGARDRPIAADLAAALTALTSGEREKLLVMILDIDEPLVLAQLIGLAPRDARVRIETRLNAITPFDAAAVRSLPEAMGRIEALLTADQADAAERFIEAERGIKTFGTVPGRDLAQFRLDLHLKLLRQDWNGILQTEPPAEFSGQTHEIAQDLINFFRGLSALRAPAGNVEGAEHLFGALHQRHPEVASYAVNLLAARVARLLGSDLFARLQGEHVVHGRKVLGEAENSILRVQNLSATDKEIFDCNKALLLLALGRPDEANQVLATTSPIRLRDRVAAYTAVALVRMGRMPESSEVLNEAEKVSGKTATLQAAQDHIATGKPFPAAAHVPSDDSVTARIQRALFQMLQMAPVQQAAIFVDAPAPFETLITDQVRNAAARVTSLAPMTTDVTIDSCEDDLSAHLREILSAQISHLGWVVLDQSKGGWTAKGNPGERDLLVQKNGATLTVLEAVVCGWPVTHASMRQDLASHFQKLFAYDHCTIFFHLTYAYVEKSAEIIDYLKKMAENDAPGAFKYQRRDDIAKTDSRPPGFIAEYEGAHGPVKVVFLLLDMQQEAQRDAAKLSATTKST